MNFQPGDKVTYVTDYHKHHGIVKRVTELGAFVVYHCDNKWDKYQDYTAALTRLESLRKGWI